MQSALISIRRGSIVACLPKSPGQRPSDPLSVACDQVLNAGGTRGLRRPLDPAAPGTPRRESVSSWRTPSASRSTGVVARRPCRLPLHWGRPHLRLRLHAGSRGPSVRSGSKGRSVVVSRLRGGVSSTSAGMCAVRRAHQANWQGSATELTTAYEVRIRHGGGGSTARQAGVEASGHPGGHQDEGKLGGQSDRFTNDGRPDGGRFGFVPGPHARSRAVAAITRNS